MVRGSRLDLGLEGLRVADNAWRKSDLRFNLFPIVQAFADAEDRQGLCNGKVQGVVGQNAPGANPASEAKHKLVRIRCRLVAIDFQESIRIEGHGFVIDFWVMREVPIVGSNVRGHSFPEIRWSVSRNTHQTFGNTMESLGIKYPSQMSSAVLVWGSPIGATGCQRRTSFTVASMYGKFGRSDELGRRSRPTTRSISSCAFLWTSGKTVMARKKHASADTV